MKPEDENRTLTIDFDDPEVPQTLLNALDRPKPFRRFKDALFDFPETRSAWFDYQSEQLRELAEDYYEGEGIAVKWKS